MGYTAVIRTLGTAGDKYQQLLDSLVSQTIKPAKIVVYIAEGYPLPKETVGIEQYCYVQKGMVAQRALRYEEVETEWMLMLDDDLYLTPDFMEKMFGAIEQKNADIVSPDVYSHADDSRSQRLIFALSGRMRARKDDGIWAYKVMRTAGFSYNANPSRTVYRSNTNAGACTLCRKADFLSIHFEEEQWMDKCMKYALGDDQIMFYKLHLAGKKILTLFDSGIIHLDAGSSLRSAQKEREMIFSDFCFKTVFWKRFIFEMEKNALLKMLDFICIAHSFSFLIMSSVLKGRFDIAKVKIAGIKAGLEILRHKEWKSK